MVIGAGGESGPTGPGVSWVGAKDGPGVLLRERVGGGGTSGISSSSSAVVSGPVVADAPPESVSSGVEHLRGHAA